MNNKYVVYLDSTMKKEVIFQLLTVFAKEHQHVHIVSKNEQELFGFVKKTVFLWLIDTYGDIQQVEGISLSFSTISDIETNIHSAWETLVF